MAYLDILLKQTAPLDPFEVDQLRDWLEAMKTDCILFGEADEDTERMNAIRRKIAEAVSPPPSDQSGGTAE